MHREHLAPRCSPQPACETAPGSGPGQWPTRPPAVRQLSRSELCSRPSRAAPAAKIRAERQADAGPRPALSDHVSDRAHALDGTCCPTERRDAPTAQGPSHGACGGTYTCSTAGVCAFAPWVVLAFTPCVPGFASVRSPRQLPWVSTAFMARRSSLLLGRQARAAHRLRPRCVALQGLSFLAWVIVCGAKQRCDSDNFDEEFDVKYTHIDHGVFFVFLMVLLWLVESILLLGYLFAHDALLALSPCGCEWNLTVSAGCWLPAA